MNKRSIMWVFTCCTLGWTSVSAHAKKPAKTTQIGVVKAAKPAAKQTKRSNVNRVATPKKNKIVSKGKSKRPTKHTKTSKASSSVLSFLQGYMGVMKSEMKRYWSFMLKRKGPKPFYMLYALQRATRTVVAAKDGILWTESNLKLKPRYRLSVRLRVGNHKVDNTGRDGYDYRAFRHMLPAPYSLPAKLTKNVLRKYLWQTTDRRFKEGMASYHRKRYVRSLKVEIKDKSGDFSKEKAVRLIQKPPKVRFNAKKWKAIAKRVSLFSKTRKDIVFSGVSIGLRQSIQGIVDTKGSYIIKHKTLYMYTVSIAYLSPKREFLRNMRLGYFDTEDKLPNEKQLKIIVQKTLQELIDQGNAEEGKPGEAPAILMPDVAGVLFHEALGHRLEAQRMVREGDGRTFRRKIGQKVIPSFLSIFDDPTLRSWRGLPLNGHYLVDDQAVRSQRVTLIKDGVLKGFLMSRKPIDAFKHSNGHGRALFGRTPFSRMGNLLVQSKRQFSPKVLRQMLLKEVRRQGKAYGYIMSRASGGYTHTGTYGIQSFKNRPIVVYRVDAKTGKQTLLKGLEMIGTPLTVVNNILATGNDFGIFNGFCGAESGYVPVSAIAPSVLLKTVEMQRVKITQKKGYLLHSPFDGHVHQMKRKAVSRQVVQQKKRIRKAPTSHPSTRPTR